MAEGRFSKVTGTLKVEGTSGAHIFEILGQSPPAELKEIPAYIATLINKQLVGLTDSEVETLKKENDVLKKRVDEKIAEIAEMKQGAKKH